MTIQEMHIRYKVGLDKVDSLQLPDMLPEEIDLILNISIEQFVRTRYNLNNVYREGFEGNEKRRSDLRSLVVTEELTNINTINSKLYEVSLPVDYWFLLREAVGFSGSFCGINYGSSSGYKMIKSNPTKLDEIEERLDDPFSKPNDSRVLTTIENNKFNIYTNGNVVGVVKLSYIRKPATVDILNNINCDLPEHTHQEIIEQAVNWTLESVESQRFGTQNTQVKQVE